jgi:hypothetical protein
VHDSDLPQEEKKRHLDWIDMESKNYMKSSKKRCQKIKSGKIPFSPEAPKWICRAQVYRLLLRFVRGKGCNRGNLHQLAYRVGIETPFLLSEADILVRIKVCQQHCKYYCDHGKQYHRQYLQEWLEAAKEEENEKAERQILGIIKQERERGLWRRAEYVMGKQHGGSVWSVQVEDEEENMEVFSTQEEVHKAIWSNIHWKQFYLAETAPICNSPLCEIFGYNLDREAGEEVLAGTFNYGEDFEEATHDICHEVALIWEIVPKDLIEEIVRKGDWEVFWKKAKKESSSSESGLHFSHYKAGADLQLISHFHAMKSLVMLKMGFGYKC